MIPLLTAALVTTIGTANLLNENPTPVALVNELVATGVEVLAVQEVTPAWAAGAHLARRAPSLQRCASITSWCPPSCRAAPMDIPRGGLGPQIRADDHCTDGTGSSCSTAREVRA